MEGDRKYRQSGYMDTGRSHPLNDGPRREERPKPQGPRPHIDITGPRLPRMVQAVTAARCFNCATALPADIEFSGNCPKCGVALHCCKQCAHFEPSTRFQCLKPVPVRISVKDQANDCTLFRPRLTVARDIVQNGGAAPGPVPHQAPGGNAAEPRNASDARAAFNSLFRKTD